MDQVDQVARLILRRDCQVRAPPDARQGQVLDSVPVSIAVIAGTWGG